MNNKYKHDNLIMVIGQLKFIFMIHKRPSATDITSESKFNTKKKLYRSWKFRSAVVVNLQHSANSRLSVFLVYGPSLWAMD